MYNIQETEKKIGTSIHLRPQTLKMVDDLRGNFSRSATIEAIILEVLEAPEEQTVSSHILIRN